MAPSSSGLGCHPLKVETRVRIPLGLLENRRSGPLRRGVLVFGRERCQSLANPTSVPTGLAKGVALQGFIRRRGSSWELRVYLGRDPITKRKRWATKTVRGGKRAAQSALAAMVAEADRGAMVSTAATVGELLERWFEQAAPDFSPKTA